VNGITTEVGRIVVVERSMHFSSGFAHVLFSTKMHVLVVAHHAQEALDTHVPHSAESTQLAGSVCGTALVVAGSGISGGGVGASVGAVVGFGATTGGAGVGAGGSGDPLVIDGVIVVAAVSIGGDDVSTGCVVSPGTGIVVIATRAHKIKIIFLAMSRLLTEEDEEIGETSNNRKFEQSTARKVVNELKSLFKLALPVVSLCALVRSPLLEERA
jgi:hypothetical protein